MINKDKVLLINPDYRSEKKIQGKIKGMQRSYWLIREKGNSMYFAEGETESKAWKNALEKLNKTL